MISLKRAYDPASLADGARVLVDRLWPRGLTKEKAKIDEWLRDLAPSDELRKWYHARPSQWMNFRKRYLGELRLPDANAALEKLYTLANRRKNVTLVFASKDVERNNATVLKDLLDGIRKPPSTSGPAAAAAAGRARAVRRRPR
jgi:uncharacterized protein YeaO (DUF488 family)